MASVMISLILPIAPLMLETVVDLVLTQNTVLNVNVKEKYLVLSMHFLVMDSVMI